MESQEKKQLIRLAGFSFDPLTEKPDLPEELRVEKELKGTATTIVQFKKPLTREERAHIQGRYGLKLTAYIPEFAYLEKVSLDTLQKLTRDPLFRASVPYYPGFKLDPEIGKRAFVSPRRSTSSTACC